MNSIIECQAENNYNTLACLLHNYYIVIASKHLYNKNLPALIKILRTGGQEN